MDHPTLPIAIGLIIILFAAWLVSGGPMREQSEAGKFIRPSAPVDSGEIYDEKLIDKERPVRSIFFEETE